MKSVYSAVRTGSLNKAVCASCSNGTQWPVHSGRYTVPCSVTCRSARTFKGMCWLRQPPWWRRQYSPCSSSILHTFVPKYTASHLRRCYRHSHRSQNINCHNLWDFNDIESIKHVSPIYQSVGYCDEMHWRKSVATNTASLTKIRRW